MNRYIPIPCELYSNYELAILRRQPMRICWRGSRGVVRILAATPVNLRTRRRGEFLIVRDRGNTSLAIRLDRILRSGSLLDSRVQEPG